MIKDLIGFKSNWINSAVEVEIKPKWTCLWMKVYDHSRMPEHHSSPSASFQASQRFRPDWTNIKPVIYLYDTCKTNAQEDSWPSLKALAHTHRWNTNTLTPPSWGLWCQSVVSSANRQTWKKRGKSHCFPTLLYEGLKIKAAVRDSSNKEFEGARWERCGLIIEPVWLEMGGIDSHN